jgi:O-antigen/teichoic acid export membrane protein
MLAEGVKGLGRPMVVSVSEVAGLAATALLLRVLVPPFGIVGAALASLGAYALTTVVLLWGLQRSAACAWRDLLMVRRDEWTALVRDAWSAVSVLRPERTA